MPPTPKYPVAFLAKPGKHVRYYFFLDVFASMQKSESSRKNVFGSQLAVAGAAFRR